MINIYRGWDFELKYNVHKAYHKNNIIIFMPSLIILYSVHAVQPYNHSKLISRLNSSIELSVKPHPEFHIMRIIVGLGRGQYAWCTCIPSPASVFQPIHNNNYNIQYRLLYCQDKQCSISLNHKKRLCIWRHLCMSYANCMSIILFL